MLLRSPGPISPDTADAKRLALGDYDQLHHFIAAGVWDAAAPIEAELLVQADRLVGGSDAVLVIDDTAIPKKGTHSVGVAAQYFGAWQDRKLPDAGNRLWAASGAG
jgi:SRSO17 transposase